MSTTAMELENVPESLLVVGGGYVALDQAQLFSRLGSQVTMLVRSRLAAAEEPEAAHTLGKVFADEGIRVVEGAGLVSVKTDAQTGRVLATAHIKGGEMEYGPARLLMATGRRAATTGLTLEAVAVRTGSAGEILVDSILATSDPWIRAAGTRCDCRVLALDHVPHALVNNDIRGFIKIVAEHGTGRILGITLSPGTPATSRLPVSTSSKPA